MNIDPSLVQLLTGDTLGQRQQYREEIPGVYREILQAHRQAQQARPGYDQFNGIIDPGDMPNSRVISPDDIMPNLATQQSSEQPDYKPDILSNPNATNDQIMNILRLLRNYDIWSRGESH